MNATGVVFQKEDFYSFREYPTYASVNKWSSKQLIYREIFNNPKPVVHA